MLDARRDAAARRMRRRAASEHAQCLPQGTADGWRARGASLAQAEKEVSQEAETEEPRSGAGWMVVVRCRRR
jgi:hypothetical protein